MKRAELAELRARLTEAEATLAAIRSGEIDALVVDGPDGPRVFTLQGADVPYRLLVEGMAEGALALADDGLILYTNRRFAAMVDLTPAGVIGMSFERLVCPADRERLRLLLQSGGAGPATAEVTLLGAAGATVPVKVSASAVPSLDLGSVALVITDLSERQEAERALTASEERYRSLIQSQHELIARLDGDGRLTFVNDAYCEAHGLARGHLLNAVPFSSLVHPDDVSRLQAAQRALDAPPYRVAVELRAVTPAGPRWVAWEYAAIRDGDGDRVEVQAVGRDVHDRRQAESRLLRAQQVAGIGFMDLDLRSNEIVLSEGACRLIGLDGDAPSTITDFVGQVVHPDDRQRVGRTLRAAIHRDWPVDVVHRIVRAEGTNIWIRLHVEAERGPAGEPARLHGTLIDVNRLVTARDQVQRLNDDLERRVRQRTSELEQAVKDMEAFSYSISHDLRGPLRTIEGFSTVLLTRWADQLAPEARRHLMLVREGSHEMQQLIDDLLAFSRLGRQPLDVEPVEPAGLVREVFAGLTPELDGRTVELAVGELPPCEADPALLKQVFSNLLGNAVKFTRPREVARIEVSRSVVDGRPVYVVHDNGVGFDPQYRDRLFQVFHRLHRAEEFEGTGIGLAIVQQIVRRHGGTVWAESTPGQGATFSFTLTGEMSDAGQ